LMMAEDKINKPVHLVGSLNMVMKYSLDDTTLPQLPMLQSKVFTHYLSNINTMDSFQYIILTSNTSTSIYLMDGNDYSLPAIITATKANLTSFLSSMEAVCIPNSPVSAYRCTFLSVSYGIGFVNNVQSVYFDIFNESPLSTTCTVANCWRCFKDPGYCEYCQDGYALTSPTNCDTLSTQISKGLNIASGYILPCTDPNCDDCHQNNTMCETCVLAAASAPQLYAFNGSCVLPLTLPDGIGADTITFRSTNCSDSNCLDCRNNYQICTSCNLTASIY